MAVIYVVEMCSPSFPRPIKIGMSVSVEQVRARISQLLTSSPYPLRLLGIIPEHGKISERGLHSAYAKHRLNGEWFLLPPYIESDLLDQSIHHQLIGKLFYTENSFMPSPLAQGLAAANCGVVQDEMPAALPPTGISITASNIETHKIYTVEEVAPILRMSTHAVYRIIRESNLPCIKLGRRIRVKGEDLLKLGNRPIASRFEI